MMTDRARNLLSTVLNILLIALAGLASMLMHVYLKPLRQGFFCDDESISKPYFANSISSALAGAVGLTGGLIEFDKGHEHQKVRQIELPLLGRTTDGR